MAELCETLEGVTPTARDGGCRKFPHLNPRKWLTVPVTVPWRTSQHPTKTGGGGLAGDALISEMFTLSLIHI